MVGGVVKETILLQAPVQEVTVVTWTVLEILEREIR